MKLWNILRNSLAVAVTILASIITFSFLKKDGDRQFEQRDTELQGEYDRIVKKEERLRKKIAGAVSHKTELLNRLGEIKKQRKKLKSEMEKGERNEKAQEFDHLLGGITRKRPSRANGSAKSR